MELVILPPLCFVAFCGLGGWVCDPCLGVDVGSNGGWGGDIFGNGDGGVAGNGIWEGDNGTGINFLESLDSLGILGNCLGKFGFDCFDCFDFHVTPDLKCWLVCATKKSHDRKIFCGWATTFEKIR